MRHLALTLLVVLPAMAHAQQALVATCGEPVGTRYDQVGGLIKQQADGFAGVNPVFFVSAEAPTKLRFVWGPAAWARDQLQLRSHMQEAIIISATSEKLTAVRVEPEGVTQMYSLYPDKGLVFFTQHRYIAPHMGGVPTSSSFYANCEFSR